MFDNDCIRLKTGRTGQIVQPIPFKGSMPSLNAIKTEYFEAHYNKPFKLVFTDAVLNRSASPAWTDLTALIEKAIEITRFAAVPKTISRKKVAPGKAVERPATALKGFIDRSAYLKVLARLQSPAYRLITIQEKYGGRLEESHIYRLQTGTGRVLIVWENTNASRAAYLFIATIENMQDQLARIEAFIHTGDLLYKRSRFQKLKENKTLRTQLCYVDSVRHETPAQFEADLKTFANRY